MSTEINFAYKEYEIYQGPRETNEVEDGSHNILKAWQRHSHHHS